MIKGMISGLVANIVKPFGSVSTIIPFTTPQALFRDGDNGAWYDIQDLSGLFQLSDGSVAVTTDTDPVGFITDKSGFNNHATADGANRGTLTTCELLKIIQLDFNTNSYDWALSGAVGTFAFASPYGAQIFTLDSSTTIPLIQFTECFFIDRVLSNSDRNGLLAYMVSKCPLVLHSGHTIDPTLGVGGTSQFFNPDLNLSLYIDGEFRSGTPLDDGFFYDADLNVPYELVSADSADTIALGFYGGASTIPPNIFFDGSNTNLDLIKEFYISSTVCQGTLDLSRFSSELEVLKVDNVSKIIGRLPNFQNLTGLRDIDINAYDTQLSGSFADANFNALTNLQYLVLYGLSNISGAFPSFSSANAAFEYIYTADCGIESFGSFSGCAAMTDFEVYDYPALTSVGSFNGCSLLSYFAVVNCPLLTSIGNFNDIDGSANDYGYFEISNCPQFLTLGTFTNSNIDTLVIKDSIVTGSFPTLSTATTISFLQLENLILMENIDWLNNPGIQELLLRDNSALESISGVAACTGLTYLKIENSPNLASLDGIEDCVSLTTIELNTLPLITSIDMLPELPNLEVANLYLDITVMPDFVNHTSIRTITFPGSLVTIGNFSGATSLEVLYVSGYPDLETIGDFDGCTSIYNCLITGNPLLVSMGSLAGCSGLLDLGIQSNDSLETIGSLENCSSLLTLTLSAMPALTAMGSLDGCSSLTEIDITGLTIYPTPFDFSDLGALTTILITTSPATGFPILDPARTYTSITYTENQETGDIPSFKSTTVNVSGNEFTGVEVGFSLPSTTNFNANNNLLTAAAVDAILAALVANNLTNGTVNLAGTGNAAPTSAGYASQATLVSRGWTVNTFKPGQYFLPSPFVSGRGAHYHLIPETIGGFAGIVGQNSNSSGTVANVGDPIGWISGNGGHESRQTTAANRPTLDRISTTLGLSACTSYRLKHDYVNDALNWTGPSGEYYIALANVSGVFFYTAYLTNNGPIPISDMLGMMILNRPYTTDEKVHLRAYYENLRVGIPNTTGMWECNVSPYTGRTGDSGAGTPTWTFGDGTVYNTMFTTTETVVPREMLSFSTSDLSAMIRLDIRSNTLTGSTPEFASSPSMNQYFARDNRLTGPLPDISSNPLITDFSFYNNYFTGYVPSIANNTALTLYYIYNNRLSGSMPSFATNTAMVNLACATNDFTGNIPSLATNTALSYFDCFSNRLTGYDGGGVSITLGTFNASNNLLTAAAVNAILADFVAANKTTGTRVLNLGGTGNAAPTGQGLTDKATLQSRGWTVTTN